MCQAPFNGKIPVIVTLAVTEVLVNNLKHFIDILDPNKHDYVATIKNIVLSLSYRNLVLGFPE